MVLGVFLIYSCFAVGHWLFCHQYYKCAKVMPYFKDNKDTPVHVERANLWREWVLLALNFLASLGMGVARFGRLKQFYNWYMAPEKYSQFKYQLYKVIYTYCKFAVFSLEIVSAVYLGIGILKLYKLAKKGMIDDRIDLPKLSLHLAAFATYLLSLVVLFCF